MSTEEGKKPMKDKLKLQFENADAGKLFYDAVASLIGKADNDHTGKEEKEEKGEKGEGEKEKEGAVEQK